jgi:hypothetical protein
MIKKNLYFLFFVGAIINCQPQDAENKQSKVIKKRKIKIYQGWHVGATRLAHTISTIKTYMTTDRVFKPIYTPLFWFITNPKLTMSNIKKDEKDYLMSKAQFAGIENNEVSYEDYTKYNIQTLFASRILYLRDTCILFPYKHVDFFNLGPTWHFVKQFNKYFSIVGVCDINLNLQTSKKTTVNGKLVKDNNQKNYSHLTIATSLQLVASLPTRIGKFNFAFFTFPSIGLLSIMPPKAHIYSTHVVVMHLLMMLANKSINIPQLFVACAPDISFQPKGSKWKFGIKAYYTCFCQQQLVCSFYFLKHTHDIEINEVEKKHFRSFFRL